MSTVDIETLAWEAWVSGHSPKEACIVLQDALIELGWVPISDDATVDLVRDIVGANGEARQAAVRKYYSLT